MLQRARASGTPADGGADGLDYAAAMRGKRQRTAGSGAGMGAAGSAAAGMAGPAVDEEPLLAVDPSLMTERQQLAFLLRATAHEASTSDSPGSEDGDSADQRRAAPAPRKKPRRTAAGAPDVQPQARGRGRPPRRPARPARAGPRTPRARQAASRSVDGENDAAAGNASPRPADERRAGGRDHRDRDHDRGVHDHDLRRAKKPAAGPMAAMRRPATADFTATAAADEPTCALCGDGAPLAAALFLCPACDRKYPTQQALGRMCMT